MTVTQFAQIVVYTMGVASLVGLALMLLHMTRSPRKYPVYQVGVDGIDLPKHRAEPCPDCAEANAFTCCALDQHQDEHEHTRRRTDALAIEYDDKPFLIEHYPVALVVGQRVLVNGRAAATVHATHVQHSRENLLAYIDRFRDGGLSLAP